MNFWIISPNVTANQGELPMWEKVIVKNRVVFMGWGKDNSVGRLFYEEVKINDVVLIAQGANKNKKLLLCGIVNSDPLDEDFPYAPAEKSHRKLTNVIDKDILEGLNLNFIDSTYGKSNQIKAIYRLRPESNPVDRLITQQLLTILSENKKNMKNHTILSLLKTKKQIILQGPPGTGKTFEAKRIAQKLVLATEISKFEVLKFISVGLEIKSVFDKLSYLIDNVNSKTNTIGVKASTGNVYQTKIDEIIYAYNTKTWLNGEVKKGNDSYSAAVAKYIEEQIKSNCIKLIQFHPSYSYEDFVRGIIAKPFGSSIEFVTQNKILTNLAETAMFNYVDSQKKPEELSKEKWVAAKFDEFKDKIAFHIENGNGYELTPNIDIIDVEEDSFRYIGKNWRTQNANKMYFRDILVSYLDEDVSRKDLIKNFNVSGLARQHASYYVKVVNDFREFIGVLDLKSDDIQIARLQNYVLIIDEINRANLPSVLGELIYAMEYRGEGVESVYGIEGNHKIILPTNLFIIGTMNTADRSVGQIDYAIQRRFAFVDFLPVPLEENFELDKFKVVSSLFIDNYDQYENKSSTELKRSEHLSQEFRPEEVWLGHTYFIKNELSFDMRIQFEIKPILKEYVRDGILKPSALDIINSL